jgi:hypothetical protein
MYTENTLVQQTTAEYLEQQLGWESIYAYNNEDFGLYSLLGRVSTGFWLQEEVVAFAIYPAAPMEAYYRSTHNFQLDDKKFTIGRMHFPGKWI